MAKAVADHARALQKAGITIGLADVLESVNADPTFVGTYGTISTNNYKKLQIKFPAEFPSLRDPELKRRVLEREVEDLRRQDPDAAQRVLLGRLRERHPKLSQAYLYRMHLTLGRAEVAEERASPVENPGSSVTVRKDIELALDVAPPGISTKELLALSNVVLQARGLAPVSTWSGLQKRYLATGTEGVERRNAKVVAEIVAEYAEAAPHW